MAEIADKGTRQTPQCVDVLPDVAAIGRAFTYAVPDAWHEDGRADQLAVGSMVRVALHGRRVAGWVVEIDPPVDPGVTLRPLAKLSGAGPPSDVVDLARWAARRWVGSLSSLLGTASPPKMVSSIPPARPTSPLSPPDVAEVHEAFAGAGAVVRIPPVGDRWPYILGAVARGNALILVPSLAQAHTLVGRLRQREVATALASRDWARGAAGATVIGGRAAAFAPVADLAAILLLDEHDEVYQEERAPTWHAREVVIERARRAGVPCVLTSPMPTPEARQAFPLVTLPRRDERSGWPLVQVTDPREDGSSRGTLWTTDVVRVLHRDGRVACVVNRKGRSRLLSCTNCDELAVCEDCGGAMRQDDIGEFVCANMGHRRPVVCAACGGTAFKNLRIGVSRAREELEALLREPVTEVTGETTDADLDGARVVVGTEAVLHRLSGLAAVVFADFDQELVAPRYRAAEEALALIVRAGRLVGGRSTGSGVVLIQTRQPSHPVLTAALSADVEQWASGESARRELLGYPPFAAVAQLSGPGADEFVDRLGQPLGIELRGPLDGAWLARASDHDTLADALNAVERPKQRLRIAVDPARL